MHRTQWLAGLITTMILLSVVYFVFGNEIQSSINFPDTSGITEQLEDFFSKEDETKSSPKSKTSTKKSTSKKGNVSRATTAAVESYKGVKVYDNGSVRNVHGRNTTADGYNLGLRYQCVEFVKRFYYENKGHKMPNSYGHAREFFNSSLSDGQMNRDRGLVQFTNGSFTKPRPDDILVFGAAPYNGFGHVAIISKVQSNRIEIVQQNPGPGNPNREFFPLKKEGQTWKVAIPYVVGWLGKR